ncbi:uncharacterized protein LOC117647930 [Thrips palmi]|uniref:Uncharacterized protein LOC117647930 n=1 Tax=Thrips palmi TaxID=161013 RepID=A0A6P8Z710_THRPL|nr:uncharacterized protein LOC117647930 [Thrips palmi]
MGYYCDSEDSPTVVIVDLETTGLDIGAHVMQVAAKCGRSIFNAYILPWKPISPQAAQITGFSRAGMNLFVHGVRKNTLTVHDAVDQFIRFLRSMGGNVVLVAHNAFNFDAFHLLRLVCSAGLWDELHEVCIGFSDTLPLYRKMYPYLGNHGLARLLQEFVPDEYFPLHNAVGDVRALDRLIEVTGLCDTALINSMRPLDDLYQC